MSNRELVVHGLAVSGHSHRVEALLAALELPYRRAEAPGPVRATPAFRALNPLGQIPVLEDGDVVLADSGAILVYLALRYDPARRWLPAEPAAAAQVQRWLAIAAGELRFGLAAARAITLWRYPGTLADAQAIGARLLAFMDGHLAERTWLAADHPTIADLACYGYVARAPEGRISLDGHAHIRAWLARVEALPRFVPMPVTPIPEAT